MTDKKEFEKLFKNSLWSDADSLAIKMEDTVYQWHIQQQIKLLEEVKKGVENKVIGDNIVGLDNEIGKVMSNLQKNQKICLSSFINSKITNLKGEL